MPATRFAISGTPLELSLSHVFSLPNRERMPCFLLYTGSSFSPILF